MMESSSSPSPYESFPASVPFLLHPVIAVRGWFLDAHLPGLPLMLAVQEEKDSLTGQAAVTGKWQWRRQDGDTACTPDLHMAPGGAMMQA